MPYYGEGLPYYYGGPFSNHSSLMTGAPRPFHTPLSRYSPHLSTITESPLSTLRRYSPSPVVSRPRRVIDTADIDVSTPRIHAAQDASQPRNHLRRDRPTIKIRCQALKDNPALREHYEKHEKSVSELLLEKYLIKDKKLDEDEKRMQLFHQVSLETDEDELQQMKNKIRRRFTRRKSSVDLQLDPEQLERQVAYAQVQAKVLDTLVAEEQAEIENQVRRGTLVKKGAAGGPRTVPGFFNAVDGEPVSQDEDEAAAQRMKRTLKKLKKKKKRASDKPSPPGDRERKTSTSSDMSGDVQTSENDQEEQKKEEEEEEERQPRLFKVEASNSVGDFSTVLVNSGPIEQFRESVRIPVPRRLARGRIEADDESETEIVLPVKKPYVKDTSRNSVHFTVKTPTDILKSDPLKKLTLEKSKKDDETGVSPKKAIPKKEKIVEKKVAQPEKSAVVKTVLENKPAHSSISNDEILDSEKFSAKDETPAVLEKKATDTSLASVSRNEAPFMLEKKTKDSSIPKIEASSDSPKSPLTSVSKNETSMLEKKAMDSPKSPLSKSESTVFNKKTRDSPKSPLTSVSKNETPALEKKAMDSPKSPVTPLTKNEDSTQEKIIESSGSPLSKTSSILDKQSEAPVLNKKTPESPKSPLTLDSKKETSVQEKQLVKPPESPLSKTSSILDKKSEASVLNKKAQDFPKPLTLDSKKETSVQEKQLVKSPESPLSKTSGILDKKSQAPVLNKKTPESPKSPVTLDSRKEASAEENKTVDLPKNALDKRSALKKAGFPKAAADAKRVEDGSVTVIVDPLSRPSSASVAEAEVRRLPKASKINTDENNAVEAPKRPLREPTEYLPADEEEAVVTSSSSPLPGNKSVDQAVTLRNAHAPIGGGPGGEQSRRNDLVGTKAASPVQAAKRAANATSAEKSDAQKTDPKKRREDGWDSKVCGGKDSKDSLNNSTEEEKMPGERPLLNGDSGGVISKSASTESIDFWNEIRGPDSPQVIARPRGFAFSAEPGHPVEDLPGLDKKKETGGAKISVAAAAAPPPEFSNIPVIGEESTSERDVAAKPEPVKRGLKKRKDLSLAIDKPNGDLHSTVKKAPFKSEEDSPRTPETCLPASQASTPVFDVSTDPQLVAKKEEEEEEEDEPKTPTNEWPDSVQPRISKWSNRGDLSNVDDATPVPSKDVSVACSPADTPESSKKKRLVKKKKSSTAKKAASKKDSKKASKDSAKKAKPQEVSKLTENKTGAKNSPKNVQRPADLIRMFYTTPSALLTATPRDLSKVRRAKIKRKKHHSRTPSVSSDSTGSTTSTATTGSSGSTCTELDDDHEHKRINSTRSNDSGFDGSPRISTPSQSSDTQRNSDSSDHFPSGRITPPATNLPRFKKYAVTDFNFLKVLGKGSFGKVLLAELRGTECVYAVKCLKKDVVLEDDDVECTLIERKVLTLATRHPYLCHLFCTFQTDSHLFFVMEYLNGGDLMFHIQKSGRFPEPRARFYAAEIWSGLIFLHKKGIVYRDLKLDNVLLDFEGHIRIADFGMCKLQIFLDRTADSFCGTPDYMAPEIIKGLKYNQAVDWWSYGVLLYEMLTGQSPFSGCDEEELFWSICNERPFIPRYLGQEATDILVALLEKDSGKRLPGHEIAVHSFFHQIQWDRLERRTLEPPFKPALEHTLDTKYFDTAFTAERPRLTPVPDQILTSMDQGVFRGFSYTNPNATD